MDDIDPFDQFDRVREAIRRAIKPLGVEFISWNISPGDGEGDERLCSVLFEVTPEAFLSEEAKAVNKAFTEMLEGERLLAQQEKLKEDAEKARQALLEIQTTGGIFREDDDETT